MARGAVDFTRESFVVRTRDLLVAPVDRKMVPPDAAQDKYCGLCVATSECDILRFPGWFAKYQRIAVTAG